MLERPKGKRRSEDDNLGLLLKVMAIRLIVLAGAFGLGVFFLLYGTPHLKEFWDVVTSPLRAVPKPPFN